MNEAATHYRRAVELIDQVQRALDKGCGTKKAERAEMNRFLNGALAALHSSAYHGETPTNEDYDAIRRRP